MEVEGKIIVKLPQQSGTSKAGNAWTKQEYVLETSEAFPKKIFFDFFGDRASQYNFEVGDYINLSFDIDSHEYNGRWFTSIRGWKGEKKEPAAAAGQPVPAQSAPQSPASAPASAPTDFSGNGDEDLPF